jgi:hypothetical protein
MHKLIITIFFLWCTTQAVIGQRKGERISIDWPGEYNWKTVQQKHDENVQTSMIIPGNESVSTASLMGSLKAYRGVKIATIADMINHYKAGLDSGTTFTLIDKEQNTTYPWIIFKVETPATPKYPEAESDLYYVVQGKFALYENYVAIKEARLSDDFVKKWRAVFMTSQIITD